MVNRPKVKGTAAESAVVRVLRAAGIPAERRAPAGANDQGDIWAHHGRVVIEVKAHATPPSPRQVEAWLVELANEVTNACLAGAPVDVGLLVVKRPGSGPAGVGDWWVYLPPPDFVWLLTGDSTVSDRAGAWVQTSLNSAAALLEVLP